MPISKHKTQQIEPEHIAKSKPEEQPSKKKRKHTKEPPGQDIKPLPLSKVKHSKQSNSSNSEYKHSQKKRKHSPFASKSPESTTMTSISHNPTSYRFSTARPLPNITISGTPGTGKTTLSHTLVSSLQGIHPSFNYADFAALAAQHNLRQSYDEARQSWVIDEDALAARLERQMREQGGLVVDWIHSDMFDPSVVDLCVTLRVGTEVLFDRLKARGYSEAKVGENIDAEIMGEVAEENREQFGGGDDDDDDDSGNGDFERTCEVWERENNDDATMSSTVDEIVRWVRSKAENSDP